MKLVIIGAGSYAFSFGVAFHLMRSNLPKPLELSLVDINSEALALAEAAIKKQNQTCGNPLSISAHTGRRQALPGADFVLTSFTVGGLSAMAHDIAIPERYGIRHTVGDTVGPGGWARAMRFLPVFDQIGADMKELCPSAWFINFSNPLSVLTRVVGRNHGIKSVGMCHGVEDQARFLATLAGAKPQARLDLAVAGVDHGSYYLKLHADGQDVLALLCEKGYCRSDDQLPAGLYPEDQMGREFASRAVFAVWRELGYMPALNDRHVCEFWPWLLLGKDGELPFGLTRTSVQSRRERALPIKEQLERYIATGDESIWKGWDGGTDTLTNALQALSGGKPFISSANFGNVGQIACCPQGAVLETMCVFDSAGVHPLAVELPPLLQALILPNVLRQEMAIDIALTGDFEKLVSLAMTDSLCARLLPAEARQLMRELLQANLEFLPSFKDRL